MIRFITSCDSIVKTDNLKKSLKQELIYIPFNYRKWLNSKIFSFYEYLHLNHLNDKDIIVFIDGYDMICIKDVQNMEIEFLNKNKDIIYSSEEYDAHHTKEVSNWLNNRYHKFLNAGFSIGYYHAYIKMYNYIMENFQKFYINFGKNEQMIISDFFMKNETKLKLISMDLDIKSKFCTTIPICKKFEPDTITSYFVHITWLGNPIQKEKYDNAIKYFKIGDNN